MDHTRPQTLGRFAPNYSVASDGLASGLFFVFLLTLVFTQSSTESRYHPIFYHSWIFYCGWYGKIIPQNPQYNDIPVTLWITMNHSWQIYAMMGVSWVSDPPTCQSSSDLIFEFYSNHRFITFHNNHWVQVILGYQWYLPFGNLT